VNRTLFIIIVLYLVWRVLHAYSRRVAEQSRGAQDFSRFSRRRREPDDESRQPVDTGDDLTACARCGVLVPRGRVTRSGTGDLYCSDGCRDAVSIESGRAHDC